MNDKKLIIIAGPTACGKTDASIRLAEKINGEIISADSMQVYKYMNIGTAKAPLEQMKGIKHYLIDELYPNEEYSAAIFKDKAKKYINHIYSKNKIPILAGGTGFYINAVLYDNEFHGAADNSLRSSLYDIAEEKGSNYLYDMLLQCDPKAAESIHKNNIKRVIRAIEFYKLTGTKISEHNQNEKTRQPAYDALFFVLYSKRESMYERIDKRVDLMIEQGLVNEVRGLLEAGYSPELVSMQGLGYKETVQYINNEISLDEAVYLIKRDTRHFAKRQLTWFNHKVDDAVWIDIENDNVDKTLLDSIKNRRII